MAISVGGPSGKAVTPQMNVTPLVDVVLVLLIIFLVVTPLLNKNFWVHLPEAEEGGGRHPTSSRTPSRRWCCGSGRTGRCR